MFPYLDLHLFGYELHLHTNSAMMKFYAVFGILAFTLAFWKDGKAKAFRAFILATVISAVAFYGARLFHLLVERPMSDFQFSQLNSFDGMTFYGSLIFGGIMTLILTPLLFKRTDYAKIADTAAILAATGYGFLRIGCFANGCCWGRLSAVPWAVRYTESEVMPAIGLPVHPVQLYDSAVGFLIAGVHLFLMLNKKTKHEFKGLLMPIFMIAYSIGRTATEFYRGDSYRGENVFLFFSTSQTISLVVALIGAVALFVLTRNQRNAKNHSGSSDHAVHNA